MTKDKKTGCIVCGDELIYAKTEKKLNCSYCEGNYETQVFCSSGHFICDDCHAYPAYKIIRETCLNSKSVNPIEMAQKLFAHPSIKMHGPEHHFLVPAVLLTAYYNKKNKAGKLAGKLKFAEQRASNVPGGFCGYYGACGAGIGTGIFYSLITDTTPVSKESWKQANMLTSGSLDRIAHKGGPRCCKRDSLIALQTAMDFLFEETGIELESTDHFNCNYSELNKECLHQACDFHTNEH